MGKPGDERDRLRGGGDLLFRVLLRHGALRPQHGGAARQGGETLNSASAEGSMSNTTATSVDHSRATGPRPAGKMPTTGDAAAVEIIAMHKWYGDFHVLRDINLKVLRGERIVICGPSGSGKS